MGVNVAQILRGAAKRWPERAAVIDVGQPGEPERAFSFAALDERARRVATFLVEHGLRAGDPVALVAENGVDLVSAWFGIVYAGGAVVPIPVLSAAPELRFRIEHARCGAVLFDAARETLVRAAVADLEHAPVCAALSEAVTANASATSGAVDTVSSDAAMILYTSGTTGAPKGAVISHASLYLHTAVLAQHALRLGEDDRVLGVLPLTHSYGCRMVMLASFFAGARAVLLPRFDAARALELLHAHAITWFPGVPTMFAALGTEPAGAPLAALRWCLSAGAPLADEVALRAERRLGAEVRQGYGMTEATFCSLNGPPDARVLGSVGKPVFGIELRVVDAQGREVPEGQDGEVVARGHNVMSRYLHDPDATALAAQDGFFHSGDVGRFDAEGRLAIVDRIKDLVIRGGYNVYPSEVEAVLHAHPDVREVAVVGRPDAYYGEEVVAIVVKREGSALDGQSLLAFARERISSSKLPREVAFVATLPLGPSGKVQKRELRAALLRGELSVERVPSGSKAPA